MAAGSVGELIDPAALAEELAEAAEVLAAVAQVAVDSDILVLNLCSGMLSKPSRAFASISEIAKALVVSHYGGDL